ncbi:DNA-binding response regulator, OmpR family, contains REC and winged-helix (wHTH) domain [Virgibacillus subterraneus]|uniref:DNA-binding response regulator, OmpR family, contains REC and winged-helix (WHTH) domain n=1 Tax=Virgibacillus subterraneus TaxID=621109 RepID=A0A1H9GCH6_9BACI|nr:response regulator transcription factor [Virgibacillus subterraneus]SEQ47794.1 DNA-binding response regulator, OmpR family, contains REC and winged-helix (wHTH) domain [Virgibacillus subterraneus]
MNADRILIVEDEAELGELVRDYLTVEGYQVLLADNGEEGMQLFHQEQPILVVLDIMLPGIDGTEVCRRIREESTIPILMMSAKQRDTDKIIGLGIGADDYITKPFSPGELVARIKAHIRRYKHFSGQKQDNGIVSYGDLKLDKNRFEVYVKEKKVDLTAKEFQLLYILVSNKGQVYTKEQLYEQVWGYSHIGDVNTVTVYIRKIREKIENDSSRPEYIQTIWGIGYRLNDAL